MNDSTMLDLFETAIQAAAQRLGVPSDSIIMCSSDRTDDTAAPRLSREAWEKTSEQVKWQLIWIAHATIESKGIWK